MQFRLAGPFVLAFAHLPLAAAQSTVRVSVDSSGLEADDGSLPAMLGISPDGRFVVFSSDATQLVAGDTNGRYDAFVHDRFTGVTERVSVRTNGAQGNDDSGSGAITGDGRFVCFSSSASNLVARDLNAVTDVFVRDRVIGKTMRVSVDAAGIEANDRSWPMGISADGAVVAISSRASNLVPNDVNGWPDVFVKDTATGAVELASVDSSGVQGNGECYALTMTPDGRFVLFQGIASNLVPGDTNGQTDDFLRDRVLGTTERVSLGTTGQEGDRSSFGGDLTPDGRFVVFASQATNLVAGDTNGAMDVFLRDRQSGTTERLSVDSGGAQGDGDSYAPAISADGTLVTFTSHASNLVAGDGDGDFDVFVHDRTNGTTRRVSADALGHDLDGPSFNRGISADGRFVSIYSYATDAVAGDTNGVPDALVVGPYLTLAVDPPAPPAGATLVFSNWTGLANGAAVIVITDVNGAPVFTPAVLGAFDAAGAWQYAATVPSGLSGTVLALTTFGFAPDGRVHSSNAVAVAFQ